MRGLKSETIHDLEPLNSMVSSLFSNLLNLIKSTMGIVCHPKKPMKSLRFSLSIFVLVLVLVLPIPSFGRLTLAPSERRILFRVQQLLQYPTVLNGWRKWTDLCYLPPSVSLTVVCSGNHVTELTVIGNKSSSSITPRPTQEEFTVSENTLSEKFSIDSFFTTLTKLSNLEKLSLVSLGLWGELPGKVNRFRSLQVLNLSSNFIYGEVPIQFSKFRSLQSIVLANNMFNGAVPDLSSLSDLKEFDVGGNQLGAKFPALSDKVVSVVLKNNKFRSVVPTEIKNFDQLQHLDCSMNQFIGTIPSDLFSLPSIQYLNLAQNEFRGAIPTTTSCNKGLGFVDLSHNFLFGDLPRCIRSNSSNKFVLYSENCLLVGNSNDQHPDSFCHEKALAVKPPFQVEQKRESSGSNKLGLVLGISGAIVGGVVVLGLILLVVFRRMGTSEGQNSPFRKSFSEKSFIRLSPKQPKIFTDARNVAPAISFGALGLPPYHVFSLEEIEEATDNFDRLNLMGAGGRGQLYKSRLRDGSSAVIRCLKLKQKVSAQSIMKHIEVMSKLRHRHLVSILGHCITTHQDYPNAANTIYIVFEHVSNGTLRNHLTEWRKRDALKWPQRMGVTIGVARGIQFLHSGLTPGIVGNNISIEDILLDENLAAKISNYSLPISSMVGSESPFNGVEDSTGTGKSDDVYQLGVILLEAITGKSITSKTELDEQRIQLERSITDSPSKLTGLADPSLRGTFAYESLRTAVEITINCLSKEANSRPSIEDVLWNLQYSVQVQDGWTPSETLGSHSGNLY